MKLDKKSNYTSMWEKTLSDNISLMRECAFIKYKDQIIKYERELNYNFIMKKKITSCSFFSSFFCFVRKRINI